MSSIAFWLAARAASFTGPGSPTKLNTERLWSGLDSKSRSVTPGVFLIASAMDSMTSFLRPSLKLGTHSTSRNLDASQPSPCQLVSLIVKRAREVRSCDRLVSRNLLVNRESPRNLLTSTACLYPYLSSSHVSSRKAGQSESIG